MKKISLVLEVSMEDAKYEEVIKWGVEPSDHVTTIIAEPLREKGFVVNAYGVETEHTMYDRLKKHQNHLIEADAYNDLEQEIIARSCVGGVCED
jgi:hypothetical protein